MTALGEQSGTLEETMASLASYYERQETMLTNIRNALTYPLILLGMLFAILLVLVTQVMPVFEKVFSQLGIEMTGVTSAVFRITHVLQGCSVVLLIGVLTAAAARHHLASYSQWTRQTFKAHSAAPGLPVKSVILRHVHIFLTHSPWPCTVVWMSVRASP